jgi:hypothetical protein
MALYGMTTSDKWWRDRERQAMAEQERLARTEARAMPTRTEQPAPLNPRGRGGQEMMQLGLAALRGRELGEPISYGGQAPLKPEEMEAARGRVAAGQQEFAEPIPVMRGMTTTYQGPRAGAEFATEGQARQAFRREQGAEYVSPGLPPGMTHMMDEKVKARNLEGFTNRILGDEMGRFSQRDPEGRLMVNPIFEPLLLRLQERAMVDPEGAWAEFERQAPRMLQESKLVNEKGIAQAMENFHRTMGRPLTDTEKRFLEPQDDPEAEKARRTWIVQWATHTPGQGGAGGVVGQVGGQAAEPGPMRPDYGPLSVAPNPLVEAGRGLGRLGRALVRDITTPRPEGEMTPGMLRRREDEEEFQRRLKPLR